MGQTGQVRVLLRDAVDELAFVFVADADEVCVQGQAGSASGRPVDTISGHVVAV